MIIEAVRNARQSIGRRIHEEIHGDQIFPRIPLEVRTLPFNQRWQQAENLDPLLKREFVRQEIMDLMGDVVERGGSYAKKDIPVNPDQLYASSLPVDLVNFVVHGAEDSELRKQLEYRGGRTDLQLRMESFFTPHSEHSGTNIRLVLGRVITPPAVRLAGDEFGLTVNASMPASGPERDGPTAEIYATGNLVGPSAFANISIRLRHWERYQSLIKYKNSHSGLAIARQLVAFGQEVLQTPHE